MIKSLNIREVNVEGSVCIEVMVYVKPRAKETLLQVRQDELIFLTKEPPLGGRANQSLIKYLSKLLKLPRRNIELVRGVKNRLKVIRICGLGIKDFMSKVMSD